jgi:hypothetical protein
VDSDFRAFQKVDMTGQRADTDNIIRDGDPTQLIEATDIDKQLWRDQPEIHRRHQALATREQLRPLPMSRKQFQRFVNAGCTYVSESRGFHGRNLPRPDLDFFGLEGGGGQRSSFVYRTIISAHATFGLVLSKLTTHVRQR